MLNTALDMNVGIFKKCKYIFITKDKTSIPQGVCVLIKKPDTSSRNDQKRATMQWDEFREMKWESQLLEASQSSGQKVSPNIWAEESE